VLEQLTYGIRHGVLNIYALKMEMWDVLWYCSEIARFTGPWQNKEALDGIAVAAKKRADRFISEVLKLTPLFAVLKMSATAGKIADFYADHLLAEHPANVVQDESPFFFAKILDLIAWMMVLANLVGISMEEIMQANLDKLAYRKANGKETGPVSYTAACA